MTFRQAEEYLLSLELFGMRFGLDRMHRLMTVLGLPQRRFASIHVVGTNGKSSTVRFCAAILERHGLRSGSYTSPHLRSFRERIEVGEQPVGEADFAAAVTRAAQAAEMVNRTQDADDQVTQFEALTAAAYHELARRGVEVAVIEAGLGGRFDATNVIPSKVQVLTSVGLEHTRWLGPTVRDIAEEKLAVVRDHGTLVVGALDDESLAVAREIVASDPLTVYDGAHNPAGARVLARSLDEVLGTRRPRVGVVGVLEDKDAAGMLAELLPAVDRVVFTRSQNPRSLSPATLASLAEKLDGPPAEIVPDPHYAVARARTLAGPDGAVLATGSIYLIADLVREHADARASML
jgi:dihydrofolate synthase/folylpolyglutamate synthase